MRQFLNRRFGLLLTFIVASHILSAQAPSGYYDAASGLTGTELRQALHDIIDDHTTISYAQILNAFWSTDNKGNGVVWDMYSDIPDGTPPYTYYLGQHNCSGSCSEEGSCYNREHAWPQSWFNDEATPRTDLHHIFPTDCFVNQQRSNYPFGNVGTATQTFQNGSKLGYCSVSGYSGRVYEPIDEYKGDFARALMYISVRYYGEDADWGSSGMTEKADLKDWAIAMLLEWNDNDPVSQKEIDRNNAIYNSYQHNRNPFIDNAEYARMIWDPNWTGTTYGITCVTGLSHGSISAPATAFVGSTVSLSATPDPGYMVDSWTVYKTGSPSTLIEVSSNGTFTMPAFNVTASATFVQNTTLYNVTCTSNLQHGSISANPASAMSGTTITLNNTPASGYSLYSYYVYKTDDINTIVYSGSGDTFTMPAYDVTVSGSFAQPSSYFYLKVTETPTDWSGEYLLVYEHSETSAYVWTGVDAANCYTEKTISNNTIADGNLVSVIVAPMSGGYSIKVNGGTNHGKYIYGTNGSNKINFGNTASLNTITYESNSVIICSNTSVMRYNNAGAENRFRYYKSGTYSSQQPVQLYKKTGIISIPSHTIQFNSNGGTGATHTQIVNEFEPTALEANTFTRVNYAFDSWNTSANGSGTTYDDGANVTLLDDLVLFAQWDPTYSITCANDIEHGSISVSTMQAVEGSIITLTATPDPDYDLDYWIVIDANDKPVHVAGNQFVMPASNVTVSAVFSSFVQEYTQKYYLVTSADQLVAGRTYLIVSTSKKKAMGTQNANDRGAVSVALANNTIANLNNACELVLGNNGDWWTLYDASYNNNEGGYLYASSSQANQLKTEANIDDNGRWSISIEGNGEATIVAQGNNTHKILRYGSGSNYFGCFQSNTQGTAVSLFIRSEEFDYEENTTLACLNSFDKHTIHSGVTLAVSNVMGTEMCNNASQLILEEGAQLLHNADGLNATMKKSISAYSEDGGWYTLGVPFTSLTPDETNGMLSNNYDLYVYDEDGDAQGNEWINHKTHPFDLTPGVGYLYANNVTHSLRLGGTLNNGNYNPTIDLEYANNDDLLRGFNLLGNPTAHEISYTQTENVSDGYYYIENGDAWTYTPSTTVPVGRGFLVKANSEGQSVTINPTRRNESTSPGAYICLNIDHEKTYIKLNEGVSMPCIELNGCQASFYALRHKIPYTMLVRGTSNEIDLCYKAHHSGQKAITVDLQGNSLDYLHLIDNLTGADINLLEAPSYSFYSTPSDYASRFELRFAPQTENSPTLEHFAYCSNGKIVLDYDGPATLQIIDLQGRIVDEDQLTPGLYLLRLITNDAVYVQKIVVK